MVELQIVHEQSHLLAMPWIAHGLVIHVAAARCVRFCQRAQSSGGIEGLVQSAVDFDVLQSFQWRNFDATAIDDGFAGIAVFVDQAFGGPGE